MGKIFTVFLALAFLTGCSGMRRSRSAQDEVVDIPARSSDSSQAFSLPGVPLKFMPPPARAKAPAPAEAPAEAKSAPAAAPEEAPAAPAAAPADSAVNGDLEYHLSSAKKYAFKKKFKSAAAEYAAAVPFLPAGDPRAVQLLERQGLMLLKAGGSEPKAKEAFQSAIAKAKELKTSGNDLANAHVGLAYCLEKANNVPEALKNYEIAKKLTTDRKVKARVTKTIADLKAKK